MSQTKAQLLEDFISVKTFGAVGDGVTDDTAAIQAALNSGASIVVFPDSQADYYISTSIVIPAGTTVRYESSNFIRIDPSANTGEVVECRSNVTVYGIKIDAANGDNLNCIGANGASGVVTGIKIIGGYFKNSKRTTAGGRGITFQLGVEDCIATGFTADSCTAAVDVHGHQDTNKQIISVSFTNFTAINCEEVASTYGLFSTGPSTPDDNHVVISNFTARNCGVITNPALGNPQDGGVFVSHRGAYMRVSNGVIVNDTSLGTCGGLFRGLGVGHSISNVYFYGPVTNLFNHTHAPSAQGNENPGTPLKRFTATDIVHEGTISGSVVTINNIANCPDQDCTYYNISIAGGASLTGAAVNASIFNTNCYLKLISRADSNKVREGAFKFLNYGTTTADFAGFEQLGLRGPTRVGGLLSWTTGGVNALGTESGTDVPVGLYRNGLQFAICDTDSFKVNSSAWNGRHLALGSWRLWVDTSGRLRIKSGAPASDTDGTIVGTQS